MSKVTPPPGLGARGTKFWLDSMAEFEPTRADHELLVEACRTMDDLDALAATVHELGTMIMGSQGQPVLNAALTEIRGARLVLHRLLSALGFADADSEPVPSAQRLRASTAAKARWAGHRKPGPGLGSSAG